MLSPLNLSLDHWEAPPVYSAKQKFVTICCSKWSNAMTQMSQAEMRLCIVTAVRASVGGVMSSGPFSRQAVGPSMAIERFLMPGHMLT